jgi:hypothetical protein
VTRVACGNKRIGSSEARYSRVHNVNVSCRSGRGRRARWSRVVVGSFRHRPPRALLPIRLDPILRRFGVPTQWEGDRPLELKTGMCNLRWVSSARSCVPLSCHATRRPSGTPPRPRLKTSTGGLPRGRPGTHEAVNTSLHLTPNPNFAPGT